MANATAKAVPETFFRYLLSSPRDRAWGLFVTTAGYVAMKPRMSYPPPGHPVPYAWSLESGRVLDEYQLHYIPSGRGTFESKVSGRAKIGPGDFFLLFPGVWHRYAHLRGTGWDEYWIGFKGEQMDRLVREGFFSPSKPLFKSRAEPDALELFGEILSKLHSEPFGFMQMVAAHTIQLLACALAGPTAREADTYAGKVVRLAKQRFHASLDREIDLHELASELNTSYTWLRRKFRQHTGVAPHQYHLQLRIRKAMHLLAVSKCTVKEAAARVGYADEYYFSRLFKRKTGRSPEGWKYHRP